MTRLGLSKQEETVQRELDAQRRLDNLTDAIVEDILNETDEEILADDTSSEMMAYALLWRSTSDCPLVHRARKVLLGALSHEEQRHAIAWVLAMAGPMTDAEMIAADMRAGVFPRRSAPDLQP